VEKESLVPTVDGVSGGVVVVFAVVFVGVVFVGLSCCEVFTDTTSSVDVFFKFSERVDEYGRRNGKIAYRSLPAS
jgi:hypothetical protein